MNRLAHDLGSRRRIIIEFASRLAAQARVDTRQGAQARGRDPLSTHRTASIVTSLKPVQGG
jgi:hypothetical protein